MEASIICEVVGNDNILKVKEEDIGKCILVINQTERGYCRVLLDGTEAFIPKKLYKTEALSFIFWRINK